MHRIICGNCHRRHGTVAEIRGCYFGRSARHRLAFSSQAHTAPQSMTPPSRELVPQTFLDAVPDGYYAVRPDEATPYTFMRVSRPKSGKWAGTTKVQTQHSDDLKLAYVVYPSGRIYYPSSRIQDQLLILVTTYKDAALAYAAEIGRCCRCNKALTDERSRWYGIGPECEQHWTWVIDFVEESRGAYHAQ